MSETKMNVYQKLAIVQSKLKAPKGQYNSFGKYNYRSCEDIVEAVKPILNEAGAILVMEDSIDKMQGNEEDTRFYVAATASFIDCETGEAIKSRGYAREEKTKKGMDSSQITGAASSYARKYALNGLFAIDDNKDSDATNKHESTNYTNGNKTAPYNGSHGVKKASTSQLNKLENSISLYAVIKAKEVNVVEDAVLKTNYCKNNGVTNLKELGAVDAEALISIVNGWIEKEQPKLADEDYKF